MRLKIAIILALFFVSVASAETGPTRTDESAVTKYGYFNEPECPNGVTPELESVFTTNNGRTWSPIYSCKKA